MQFPSPSSSIILLVCLCLYLVVDAAPRPVTQKQEVLAVLGQIPNRFDIEFLGWVNNGDNRPLVLGETIQLSFRASDTVFVYVAYIDTDGVLSLFEPSFGPAGNILSQNITMSFPAPNSNLEITVEPPLGPGTLLFVATASSLPEDWLTKLENGDRNGGFRREEAGFTDMAHKFKSAILAHNSEDKIAVSIIHHEIVRRIGDVEYTIRDIVGFFSGRGARSITNPVLDADIRFQTGSHLLTRNARTNLDVWGESLLHPYLVKARFEIGGHTDDVGSARSNLDLSQRRAQSVAEYLSSKFGIEKSRFTIHPFGEAMPKVTGTDEQSRLVNRRVEFLQITN